MDRSLQTESGPESIGLPEMARVFLKVGATGFGGAMPMLAMIHGQVVEKRRWVSQEEFDEGVALGQILPGPMAVNAVVYMAYRRRGLPGAVVSAVSFFLPSFLMMLALSVLYLAYGSAPQLSGVLRGLGAAVVAVILSAVWRMGKPLVKDPRAVALVVLAFTGMLWLQLNVVLLVLLAGATGVALFRKPTDFPMAQKKGGKN